MAKEPMITLIIGMGKMPKDEHYLEEEGEMEKPALQRLKEKYLEQGRFKGKEEGGEWFQNCVRFQMKVHKIPQEQAEARCAVIGKRAYGAREFQEMAGKK
ncbi:MAG: hypothetical protein DDT19_00247 [Syntrophomonadaceae bacterium]|nr:hypothetical protein [Bacillota bacterium]